MEVSRSAAAQFIRIGRDRARRAAGRVVLGSLVCAVSVMCATSAQAQPQVSKYQEHSQDFPFGDYDPCISAVVSGQGHFSLQLMDRSTPTTSDITFRIHQNGQGTSTVDTAKYQYEYMNDHHILSSATNYTFTMQLRKHIIRQGPMPSPIPSWMPYGKDDYFATESVPLSPQSPNPSFNNAHNESTCK
jgi:hypothetical protein